MAQNYSCVINKNGFYVGCVYDIDAYPLKDGETLVDTSFPTKKSHADADGFVYPVWSGEQWAEGATAEEITAWEKAHPGPSLAQAQADKLEEINAGCDAAIAAGCGVTLADGTEGHISLTLPDQINLSTAQAAILAGGTGYAYHLDGALCEVYSAEDIAIMARAATDYVLYHQTYCNHVRAWVKRCTTVVDVHAIAYGTALPDDLATHMAAVIAAARGGNA